MIVAELYHYLKTRRSFADEARAEGFDSKERSCVMIQTQYYLSNLSSSYNILQDCGNCSRSVHERRARLHYTGQAPLAGAAQKPC